MNLQRAINRFVAAGIVAVVCFAAVANAEEYAAPAATEPCIGWADEPVQTGWTISLNPVLIASRWEPMLDLPPGKIITSITTRIPGPPASAAVQIWQGADAASMELMYSQAFTPNGTEMTEVVLDTPYFIDYSKELLIGYSATQGTWAVSNWLDVTTNPNLKGGLIFYLGSWKNISSEFGVQGDVFIEACLDDIPPPKHLLDTGDPNERVCNPRSYTEPENGIVRDDTTGLEWMRPTSTDVYTWDEALAYVQELNDNETLGYDDWRLPTIEELSTLVDSGRNYSAIDPIFDDTVATYYWSSTTFSGDTAYALNVFFRFGGVRDYLKSNNCYVRAVRGEQYGPFGNFISNNDGTITDTTTDLMWQQCGSGQAWDGDNCTGSAVPLPWYQVFDYVQELNDNNTLGYDDWRMPTRNELQSLIDYSSSPAKTFPNTESDYYWSSTDYNAVTDQAWRVSFDSGWVSPSSVGADYFVRAVRGGPCRSEGDWCLDDSDCDDGDYCDTTSNSCVECLDNSTCDNGDYCDGAETCVDGSCQDGTAPDCFGDTPFCDEAGDTCVECLDNSTCDNGDYCDGAETCAAGACQSGTAPSCSGDTPFCDEAGDICVECLDNSTCDDGLHCNGVETCAAGACQDGTAPSCTGDTPFCDEAGERCVECLDNSTCDNGDYCDGAETCAEGACQDGTAPNCTGDTPFCDEAGDTCVECLDNSTCDNDDYCDGAETCADGACQDGTAPSCTDDTPFCDEAGDTCVECLDNSACDDGLHCNGAETCAAGACQDGTAPSCSGDTPYCDEAGDTCVECLVSGNCANDSLFCTGAPTCTNNECGFAEDSCDGATPVCDEAGDRCVGCLVDGDCDGTEWCRRNVCLTRCELIVTHKEIKAEKLTKPRKFALTVTSQSELFDIFARVDLGPFTLEKRKFSSKKNQLKIIVIVPAGLAPGSYPISVGDCFGEVVITGTEG